MKKLDLEISTLSVEIKVLTLSGKRFTNKTKWFLWKSGGVLYKCADKLFSKKEGMRMVFTSGLVKNERYHSRISDEFNRLLIIFIAI